MLLPGLASSLEAPLAEANPSHDQSHDSSVSITTELPAADNPEVGEKAPAPEPAIADPTEPTASNAVGEKNSEGDEDLLGNLEKHLEDEEA